MSRARPAKPQRQAASRKDTRGSVLNVWCPACGARRAFQCYEIGTQHVRDVPHVSRVSEHAKAVLARETSA